MTVIHLLCSNLTENERQQQQQFYVPHTFRSKHELHDVVLVLISCFYPGCILVVDKQCFFFFFLWVHSISVLISKKKASKTRATLQKITPINNNNNKINYFQWIFQYDVHTADHELDQTRSFETAHRNPCAMLYLAGWLIALLLYTQHSLILSLSLFLSEQMHRAKKFNFHSHII